jgi:hypothetical protein
VLFELYYTKFYDSDIHVWWTLVLIRMNHWKILVDRDSIKTSFDQRAEPTHHFSRTIAKGLEMSH